MQSNGAQSAFTVLIPCYKNVRVLQEVLAYFGITPEKTAVEHSKTIILIDLFTRKLDEYRGSSAICLAM